MTRKCPKCGKIVPDDSKFCMDCGYAFDNVTSDTGGGFNVGMLFVILIIAVLIVGAAFILTSGDNTQTPTEDVDENYSGFDLVISDVSGWDYEGERHSYTLYTSVLFNEIPDDTSKYTVKTTYYDDNDTEIGHETEKLDEVYYDTDYSVSVGHYTTYTLPDPDHVTVEIIKKGNVVDSFTEKIDKSKIDYLN